MIPCLKRRVHLTAFVLALALLSSCATSSLAPCSVEGDFDPPANFLPVVDLAGHPAGVYRGAQPESCDELQYLRSIGVRSILKLNDRGLTQDESEIRDAEALGFVVRSFAFNAFTIGRRSSCDQVRDALGFLADESNWPVYVHCSAGKDRTGYIVGMFERFELDRDIESVLEELHAAGHSGIRSLLMNQIDRELASPSPVCMPASGRVEATASMRP